MNTDTIRGIDDPMERAKAAEALITEARTLIDAAAEIRSDAITELLATGLSVRKVAAEVGLSASRVHQVRTTPTAPTPGVQ